MLDADQNDHVIVETGGSLLLTTTTISGWLEIERISPSVTAYSTIVTRQIADSSGDDFLLGLEVQQPRAALTSDAATDEFGTTIVDPGRLVHLALTWDLVDLRLFIDGVLVDGRPLPGTRVSGTARPIFLGAGRNNDPVVVPIDTPDCDFVDGLLDEIRIEHTARSPAWIAADVASMRDELVRYGAVEEP